MKKLIFALLFGLFSTLLTAQCGITADLCQDQLTEDYLSDGHNYRALLLEKQVAEFSATLFGGSTYRFAACSGVKEGNLRFRVYDLYRNLIFNNVDYKNASHWDFKVENTIDVVIEAELDPIAGASGCAVLLIGYLR